LEIGGGMAGAALAAAVCAVAIWHLRRSRSGPALLVLRGLAALALAGAALRPTVAWRQPQLVKPRLLVLVDNGHPMAAAGGGLDSRKGAVLGGLGDGVAARDQDTRLAAARSWLLRHRDMLEQRCDLRFYALADRGRRLAGWDGLAALSASAAGFHPAAALRDVADDLGASLPRAERAWLFSDGNAEPDPELDKAIAEAGLPMDVLGVGPARRAQGVAFAELNAPDFAFLHGRVAVEAALEASAVPGQALDVVLYKQSPGAVRKEICSDGTCGISSTVGGWLALERKSVPVRSDFEVLAVTFTATAQSLGTEKYRLEAGLAGGRGPAVSRAFRVEVIRQKYRIMYLSGRPSAEYSNLREFLKADPNHELVSFVILRNPENPPYVPDQELSLIPFPAEEIFVQTLSQFDLFILENFSYSRFHLPAAYLHSLKSFVAGGGALLVIGGENAFSLGGYKGTPLEDILPVTLSDRVPDFVPGRFRAKPAAPAHPLVQVYDTIPESHAAWEALPELDGYAHFASVRPGATVLAVHPQARTASGEPAPVFAIREYGRGKVMLVSSDSTWRWRLGAALDWKSGDFYGRFWTRAVQYLTGSLELSKVKFSPLPDRLPPREPAGIALRVFDESFQPAARALTGLSVLWTAPGGAVREAVPREIGPGEYALELTGLAPGTHKLRAWARYRGRPWGEDTVAFEWAKAPPEAPMDRKWLRHAAEAAGGSLIELPDLRAEALLAKLSPVRRQDEVSRRQYPWASLWWLAAAVALFLGEWAGRRWKGWP
jgi:uncharacterized membrane protein